MFYYLILILTVLVSGCAGETSEAPPAPLKCKAIGIIETPQGERLSVECNRSVPNPPPVCEETEPGVYACNIYHASQEDCEAFPGMCDAQ
jgi:hypothetical protein